MKNINTVTHIINILKDLKENMNIMRREIKKVKKKQMELLQIKNSLSEKTKAKPNSLSKMKNSHDSSKRNLGIS